MAVISPGFIERGILLDRRLPSPELGAAGLSIRPTRTGLGVKYLAWAGTGQGSSRLRACIVAYHLRIRSVRLGAVECSESALLPGGC
jgi:hypothetical protein